MYMCNKPSTSLALSIYWIVCDGGECNRSMIKMLFNGEDRLEHNFMAYNIHTGKELVVMVDCEVSLKYYPFIVLSSVTN